MLCENLVHDYFTGKSLKRPFLPGNFEQNSTNIAKKSAQELFSNNFVSEGMALKELHLSGSGQSPQAAHDGWIQFHKRKQWKSCAGSAWSTCACWLSPRRTRADKERWQSNRPTMEAFAVRLDIALRDTQELNAWARSMITSSQDLPIWVPQCAGEEGRGRGTTVRAKGHSCVGQVVEPVKHMMSSPSRGIWASLATLLTMSATTSF